ncbi:Hsp20/alpha crystallin family protein [Herpetosiphon geysericola]|uniref:Heat-shock protein Hsp20 n=1 Tax=Herpetosiphon geysericola TaxID=70996 RepID=A0A0P6Y4R6_9CHLR|nr:Hsp20/alpha crystallin family protein [Herpetosiphon geysericola]KPL91150.1 heat-shock protein Hsp20 [Herpetosiphon geysericola]
MATINRWSPVEEALSLRDAMSRLFEESFVAPSAATRTGLSVDMNVLENANSYIIEAAVPGLKAEDLDITLQENVLTISGEIRNQKLSEGTTAHRTERRYGRFSRSITLPMLVKGDEINATLEHGILRLDVPKAEEVKPRKISVQVGGPKELEVNK